MSELEIYKGMVKKMKNDEIKNILDKLNNCKWEKDTAEITYKILFGGEVYKLLDYITNLQQELEDLREENWAWHQTLKAQNKREYRSKFLKDFQKEYNTSTFPDYDEIYKRYDRLKKENEMLKQADKNTYETSQEIMAELTMENDRLKKLEYKFIDDSGDNESFTLEEYLDISNKLYDSEREKQDYKSRCEKAVKWLITKADRRSLHELIDILNGSDE